MNLLLTCYAVNMHSLVHVLEHPDVCDGSSVISKEVDCGVDDVDILVRAVIFH